MFACDSQLTISDKKMPNDKSLVVKMMVFYFFICCCLLLNKGSVGSEPLFFICPSIVLRSFYHIAHIIHRLGAATIAVLDQRT